MFLDIIFGKSHREFLNVAEIYNLHIEKRWKFVFDRFWSVSEQVSSISIFEMNGIAPPKYWIEIWKYTLIANFFVWNTNAVIILWICQKNYSISGQSCKLFLDMETSQVILKTGQTQFITNIWEFQSLLVSLFKKSSLEILTYCKTRLHGAVPQPLFLF